MERLKAKFTVLENTTVQKHKQALTELELENKKLQQDLASAKLGRIYKMCNLLELDRVRDADSLIPHYRLAVMKVRAQVTTLTEKLDQQTQENVTLRQELVTFLKIFLT